MELHHSTFSYQPHGGVVPSVECQPENLYIYLYIYIYIYVYIYIYIQYTIDIGCSGRETTL